MVRWIWREVELGTRVDTDSVRLGLVWSKKEGMRLTWLQMKGRVGVR